MTSQPRKIFAISELCTACRSCEIACAVAHSRSASLIGAILEVPLPRYRIEVQAGSTLNLPLNCRHCDEPECLFACKAGAVSKDEATGQVRVDLEKCVGCWMCVMICPYGAVIPDALIGKAAKCDLCENRAEGPACVTSCLTGALFYGTEEEFEEYRNTRPLLKQLKAHR
ncbi:MAG: 4Fe-4S dicluster domain-containing protein [bacterium]|nr:4Fe-4S dicluster domain-containing protein [bacterium]